MADDVRAAKATLSSMTSNPRGTQGQTGSSRYRESVGTHTTTIRLGTRRKFIVNHPTLGAFPADGSIAWEL